MHGRSASFDTATELHQKQDLQFRESLAADMIRTRRMYVPFINAAHDELADLLVAMERCVDAEAATIDRFIWSKWGFCRVESDGVVGYELENQLQFNATLKEAEVAYKCKIRAARLARFTPSPGSGGRGGR